MKKIPLGIGMLFALVIVALLACSPQTIVQELLGEQAQKTSTPFAVALATPAILSTVVSSSPPIGYPLANACAGYRKHADICAGITLRTDLPALALRDWQRPANDNGRCIHFLPTGYFSQRDFDIQIPRMKDLQMRWVLAIYSDENQLRLAAPQFKAAGITPVWRRYLRAYQRYYAWDRDIQILKENGLPPYFQIYNEPDTEEEWDGRDVNRDQWIAYVTQTAKDVYNAGGYVGLQVLDRGLVARSPAKFQSAKRRTPFRANVFFRTRTPPIIRRTISKMKSAC